MTQPRGAWRQHQIRELLTSDGPLPLGQIATRFGITASSAGVMLMKMKRRGEVRNGPSTRASKWDVVIAFLMLLWTRE